MNILIKTQRINDGMGNIRHLKLHLLINLQLRKSIQYVTALHIIVLLAMNYIIVIKIIETHDDHNRNKVGVKYIKKRLKHKFGHLAAIGILQLLELVSALL